MSRVRFADTMKATITESQIDTVRVTEAIVDEAYTDWVSRYGDNARVGGLDLEDSTIRRKGFDRKLIGKQTGGSSMRDSIRKVPVEDSSTFRETEVEGAVVTDHWLFPIHEYGLNQPGRWKGTNAMKPRTTLTLTERAVCENYPKRVERSLRRALTSSEGLVKR